MYVCKSCGQTYSAYTTICSKCGNAVVEAPQAAPSTQYQQQASPTYASAPVYQTPPVYPQGYPAAPTTPAPSGGAIALGVIGLLIGIESLIASFVSMIFSIISVGVAQEFADYYNYNYNYSYSYDYYSYSDIEAIEIFTVFAFIQLFVTILGLVFSSISRGKGVGGVAVTGKVFNIIALVFSIIATIASVAAMSILPKF